MRFLLPIRHGLARLRRHPLPALFFYLASLLPAALLMAVTMPRLDEALSHSPAAGEALAGDELAVLLESGLTGALPPLGMALPSFLGFALLLQLLATAGAVEVLLERSPPGGRPFLTGIGRHVWPFLRSAVWFALALVPLAVFAASLAGLGSVLAFAMADARLQVAALALAALVAGLLFVPLDLAYDLSRLAAASHGGRRTGRGFLAALFHVVRKPGMLLPFYLVFAALGAVAALLPWLATPLLAGRPEEPIGAFGIAAMLLIQQLGLLLRAAVRLWRWAAEVSYYQAIGEPGWCEPPRPAADEEP